VLPGLPVDNNDLHADQIQGFFDVPVDHLYASGVFIEYIKGLKLENLVIAAPMWVEQKEQCYANFLAVLWLSAIRCEKSQYNFGYGGGGDVKGWMLC